MSKKYPASFEWSIKFSIVQQKLLIVVHVLAITALVISAIAPVYKALFIVLMGLSGWHYWHAYGVVGEVLLIRYTDASGWELATHEAFRPVSILKSTVVTPAAIILHYRQDNKTRYRAVFNDALTPEDFKRLIVQLKITGFTEL